MGSWSSENPLVSASHRAEESGYPSLFMWVLGIPTLILTLVRKILLSAEPSPKSSLVHIKQMLYHQTMAPVLVVSVSTCTLYFLESIPRLLCSMELHFSWKGGNPDDNKTLQIAFASPYLVLSSLYLFPGKNGNYQSPHMHTVLEMRKMMNM